MKSYFKYLSGFDVFAYSLLAYFIANTLFATVNSFNPENIAYDNRYFLLVIVITFYSVSCYTLISKLRWGFNNDKKSGTGLPPTARMV